MIETPTTTEPQDARRSLFAATLIIALLAVAGGLVLNAGARSGPGALNAEIAFFAAFAGLSIFFLAGAKYVVSRERVYLPIALGLLASSLFALAQPTLSALQGGPEAITSAAPESGPYLGLLARLALGLGLLAAAFSLRQGALDDRAGRWLARGSIATLIGAGTAASLTFVVDLPPFHSVRLAGGNAFALVPLLLYLPAAGLFVVERRPSGIGLRWVAVTTLGVAAAGQAFWFRSAGPLDGLDLAGSLTVLASHLVLIFGLYLEHIRLYSVERSLRESLETAHVELRGAKTELDAIIEDLTDGIAIADASGRLIRFNRAAQDILGREAAPITLEKWAQHYGVQAVDGRPLPLEQFPLAQVLRTGQDVRNREMAIRRPSGERRIIVVGAVPIRDGRGRIRGAVAALSDVTDIRTAEQRFRDLTEGAPDGILVVDDNYQIVLFNKAAEELFGYRREEVYGNDVAILIPERLGAKHHAARRAFQATGKMPILERPLAVRGLRKDGTEIPVEVSVSGSQTASGLFFIAHVRDITDRERSRREREGLLSVATASSATDTGEQFLERAAQAITRATDFDACTIYLRDANRNALVLQASDKIPDEVRDRIRHYPLDPSFPAVAVRTWFERQVQVESHLQARTDLHVSPELLQKYHFQTLISTPFGPEDEPWGVLQVVAAEDRYAREDDVQLMQLLAEELAAGLRQKRLIDQLEEAAKDLRIANQELDSFIYTASHDLAEPLRSISNFSHFLLEDYSQKLDEEGRDYLERVHAGALRMKRLLDDLLRLSRHGRTRAPRSRVRVADVIQEVRESLDATLQERGATVEVEGELPDVVADRTSLIEVFVNLISNGVKFNQNPEPRVTIQGERLEGIAEFRVIDNGIGIPPEHHERIFGLFTRLHTRKEYPGTGAGLAIVKKVIENHGGRIWVESEPEKGSKFLFTLPAAPAPAGRLEVAQPGATMP